MRKKRIGSLLTAAAMLCSTAAAMPALPVLAADVQSCPLEQFAAEVQAIVRADESRSFFDEIVYDAEAGTLTGDDGIGRRSLGMLYVRNGSLMLRQKTVNSGGGSSTGSADVPFDEAGEKWGYQTASADGKITVTNEFQTARLIVKAAGRIDTSGTIAAAEGYRNLHILQYPDSAAAYAAYQRFARDSAVEFVQPSHRLSIDTLPDSGEADAEICDVTDGVYNTWGAQYIGTESFIKEYLNAELLPEVVVAVIDTGLNTTPKLFDGRILDGGINMSDSGDDSAADDSYHGTHVTGTICELTTKNVKILPIKVFKKDGKASEEQMYLGMMYAVEHGADVLNMSFGGLGVYPLEIEAMSIADENDVICCAAAGNNYNDAKYYYPGGIESVITVGAVTQEMERAEFSNSGDLIDVVAPGYGIVSYGLGEGKRTENGTSMATPHVTACCALLRSYDKTMTPRRAEALLRLNATDLGPKGFDPDFGWGMVNMANFRWDDGICPAPLFSRKSGSYGTAQTVSLSVNLPDAEIRYTTDGTLPDAKNGKLYKEPITISETTQLLAVAVREGWADSAPAEAVYIIGTEDVRNAYTVKDGVLLSYRGIRNKLSVPDKINGERIEAIGARAFAENHFVTEITLPDSVSVIGEEAFADCSKLQRIYAPGVEAIDKKAFVNARLLADVMFQNKLKTVGDAAFSDCVSLTEIVFSGITELPAHVFENCTALVKAECQNVTALGDLAFNGCKSLEKLQIRWQNVRSIGVRALAECPAWEGVLHLSALESLGESAFAGDILLRSVMLPESMHTLPSGTFLGCTGLRLLSLSGITSVGDHALALREPGGTVQVDLPYDKITKIGTGAFNGFTIGSGYDIIEFTKLDHIDFSTFTGVRAGGLSFPAAESVAESAFEDAAVGFVILENASEIGSSSLLGCSAVVLSEKIKTIAPNAVKPDAYFVVSDAVVLPEAYAEAKRCNEPLLLRRSSEHPACVQHQNGTLRVLAYAPSPLKFQWYRVSGETRTALPDETGAVFTPDTAACGVFDYVCVMTDADGKTEEAAFSLTISEAPEYQQLEMDTLYTVTASAHQTYQITVPESGSYRLTAEGAASAAGVLSDASGRAVAKLETTLRDGEGLTAELKAGETYYLETAPRWNGSYALLFSGKTEQALDIAACDIRLTVRETYETGSGYQPEVRVYQPDGSLLTENTDYVLEITPHNQYFRIGVYGIGRYSGYAGAEAVVYERIAEDTPIPVKIDSVNDRAVYLFVPKKTAEYSYYATYAAGYAEEQQAFLRSGRYPGGSHYANLVTSVVIADTAEGNDTVYARKSYSSVSGTYFNDKIKLYAGQRYYFICKAESEGEYALVVTPEPHDIRKAKITGSFLAVYGDEESFRPKIRVTLNGEQLQEGVDYIRVDSDNDVPGKATVTVLGMGRYFGQVKQQYEIVYPSPGAQDSFLTLDKPVEVTCAEQRVTNLWFRVEQGETANDAFRYRVLNSRVSGGMMNYSLYRYDPATDTCSLMTHLIGAADDYMLTNGIYCIAVSRRYRELASKANFSVIIPYSLEEAEMTVKDMPYTGSDVPNPVTLTAPDGTVLKPGSDYLIQYTGNGRMFGTEHVTVYATNRTYGMCESDFQIYVDLPEDAPELEIGSHEVTVTIADRLAVYRVSPEKETSYILGTTDVADIVLRVFSPDAECLAEDYEHGTKSISFTVPAGETRYVMVKFNGVDREGTIHFRLETELRLLSDCTVEKEEHLYTGEKIQPQIRFIDGDYTLVEDKDYRLRYTADDVNIGTAYANFEGIGRYFGVCDVAFDILAPDLKAVAEPFPLALDDTYAVNMTGIDYLLYSYTAGTDTDLHMTVFEAGCKLSVQYYNEEGVLQDSVFFKADAEMNLSLKAGETAYFLISATDISSKNQKFNLVLHDKSNADLNVVEDREGGFSYRVGAERKYAEVYDASQEQKKLILQPEINGVPVSFVPEAVFAQLKRDTVVIGYAGCGAAKYADRYHFIYQQALSDDRKPLSGDLNGDGTVSEADAVLLAAVLAEYDRLDPAMICTENGDLNGNGIIELADLNMLQAVIKAQAAEE